MKIQQEDGSWVDEQTVLRRLISQGLDPERAKARIHESRSEAKKKSEELIAGGWRRNKNGTMSPPKQTEKSEAQ